MPSHAPDAVDPGAVLAALRGSPADFVKVAVTDVDGVLRGKYLDKAKFLAAAESGFGFCNVVFGWDVNDDCYDNVAYTGWESGYPDAEVRIDLSTHRQIPWEADGSGVGRDFFLGEFVEEADGSMPLGVCPRGVLRRVVDCVAAAGMMAKVGMEFEWFNFAETPQSAADKSYADLTPLTPGMFGYSVLRQAHNQPFFEALLSELRAFDVPIEGLHTETGPGVLEAAILYSDALTAADRGQLFKSGVKEIAHRFGILPTFMARVSTDLPGSSGHIHQSLWDLDGERNLFARDGTGPDGAVDDPMSPTFRSYLAGVLALLPELLPFWAPTVNSYKRLVEGFWAPTHPTWGYDNRTVAARVIGGSSPATRLELRVPGADVNPYLAVAASLAAGVWGVEQGLKLDAEATVGSAYRVEGVERFPATLQEATERLHNSTVARELFGGEFVDHFVATREWEWRQYAAAVTDWERRRYLEII